MKRQYTSKRHLCPVCGNHHGCAIREDDLIECLRCTSQHDAPPGYRFIKLLKNGMGGLFTGDDSQQRRDFLPKDHELQRQRQLKELAQGALGEIERDKSIRRIHKYFGLALHHRQNLRTRGLSDAHIQRLPYFSFHPSQEVPQFTPANLPGVRRGKLALIESGFACPIPNIDGLIIGWQNRFDNTTNGKYRWPKGEKSIHLPNAELPIGVYRPDDGATRYAIGHSEGFLKADIIAQSWGIVTLGAAGANFAASPSQHKQSLDRLSIELNTKDVHWFADAGAVANPHVVSQYLKSWENLAVWGYSVKIVWYGQIEKSAGDADEVSQETRESAKLITIDEYLALAREEGGYTEFTQRTDKDRSISRDEWELKFGLGAWLPKTLRGILGKALGFEKKPESPRFASAPPSIIRYPQQPLPCPEDYESHPLPRIIFKQGKRLEVLTKLRELGWKYVCDRSFMGLGKSHDAGLSYPDPDTDNKIWYFDLNHTNPTTETVEGMTNMPPRHKGMVAVEGKFTPRGNPHLRWAHQDEVPMVPSLCYNADIFIKLRQKGYNVDANHTALKADDGKFVRRNDICRGCRFAGKCHQERGDGYGYLMARRGAMEARRIRASLDSAPSPVDYDYGEDIAFVEEASRYLRGTQTLSAIGNELSQAWGYVERKAPVAFAALQFIRFALTDALEGKFDQIESGFNRGANHERLLENLPNPSEFTDLPILIQQVASALPKVKDVVEEPDSVTGLGGKWRSIGQQVRNIFKAEAARQTKENIESLPPNLLVDALEVWAGLKPGALRVSAGQLRVTVRDTRHADVLNSMKFVCLLDATGSMRQLAQVLGVEEDTIIEIEQEKPNLANLTVTNVNMLGMGSKRISDACKARQKAFLEWVITQHEDGEVRVLANKADSHLPLDGWWFNDNRSTNTFKGVGAIAAFNTPRVNLGTARDEYLALFGNLEEFDEYYSSRQRAEIIQLIGRQRAQLHHHKNFTIYLVGTNQDVSYLQEYGIRVINKEAFELCPEAGTPDQITRWKILMAVGQLLEQGQKLTQEAIGCLIGKSQELVSKIASEFGGWKSFKKLLLALLGLYRDGNNFEKLSTDEKNLIKEYLAPVIDLSVEAIGKAQAHEDVQRDAGVLAATIEQCLRLLGFPKFLIGVRYMPADSQANLLCVFLQVFGQKLIQEVSSP